MKAIKKVEVTPLDYNIGKIIDSYFSTDDKTKNTYSMNTIDNYFLSQLDAREEYLRKTIAENLYFLKDNFATLTGSFVTSAGEETINYPNGFTNSNCVVISQMQGANGSGQYSTTDDIFPLNVTLTDDYILLEILNPPPAGTRVTDYKIVLMKVS